LAISPSNPSGRRIHEGTLRGRLSGILLSREAIFVN
jgi:hypothetical protein